MHKFLFHPGDLISHGDVNAFAPGGNRLHDETRYLFNDYGSLSNLENYNTTLFVKPITIVLGWLGAYTDVNYYRAATCAFLAISYASITVFLRWLFFEKSGISGGSARVAQFIGALLYVFSPYVLNVYAAGGFWLAYGLTPAFVLLSYQLFARRARLANLLMFAAVCSLLAVGTQYLFYSAFVGAVIAVVEVVGRIRSGDKIVAVLAQSVGRLAVVLVAFVAMNLHWLFATLSIYGHGSTVSPGYALTKDMISTLGARSTLFNTAVSADSWTQVNDNLFSWLRTYSDGAVFMRWVVALVSLAGLFCLRNRLNKRVITTLLGIFVLFWSFSIGLRNPLYSWLSFDSPIHAIGWIFRAPSKLTYILWLVYSAGFTSLAIWLFSRTSRQMRSVASVGLVVLALSPSFNKFYSLFQYYYVPTDLPSEYKDAYAYLKQVDGDGAYKAAYLAPFQYGFGRNSINFESSFTWDAKKQAGQIVEQSSPVPAVGYWHMTYRNWQDGLYQKIYPEFSGKDANANIPNDIGKTYLAPANVKYLVFHNDIVNATDQGERSVQRLNQTDLKLVKQFGFISIYENPYAQPLLFSDQQKDQVSVTKDTPTSYRFTAHVDDPKTVLTFAQAYDAYWQVKIDGKTVPTTSLGPDALTGFEPGAQDVTGTITYLPQKAFHIGSLISLPVFLFTLGFVAASSLRRNFVRRRPTVVDLRDAVMQLPDDQTTPTNASNTHGVEV